MTTLSQHSTETYTSHDIGMPPGFFDSGVDDIIAEPTCRLSDTQEAILAGSFGVAPAGGAKSGECSMFRLSRGSLLCMGTCGVDAAMRAS